MILSIVHDLMNTVLTIVGHVLTYVLIVYFIVRVIGLVVGDLGKRLRK